MRKRLLILLSIPFGIVGPVHAEYIGVFKDTSGCPCQLYDTTPGLMRVTVLHVNSPGATWSRFGAPVSSCMYGMTWLSDAAVFPGTVGNSQEGVSIDYGRCLTGTFQILAIDYFVQGFTEECCFYHVLPAAGAASGEIEVGNCKDDVVFVGGLFDIINSSPSCWCPPPPDACYPVAVESSTWGKIKILYQQ